MNHPPTQLEGPLLAHEVGELSDLLDDLDWWTTSVEDLPEDLRLRIAWWALRLEHAAAGR